jgi:DNA polymerase I-like protein with 3'-5' exonuclease and polymerase domains
MKHIFENFIMPLTNVVLAMGLKGVLVNQQALKDFRVQFERERITLVGRYRFLAAPAFNIHFRWKQAVDLMEQAPDAKVKRSRMSALTALHKEFISELNPASAHKQKKLFYDIWKLPVQKNWKTKKATTDEEAILKLLKKKEVKNQPAIKELLLLLLELRGINKKISTYCLEENNVRERVAVDSELGDQTRSDEPVEDSTEVF